MEQRAWRSFWCRCNASSIRLKHMSRFVLPCVWREREEREREREREQIICCRTAHPALDKACHYFDVKVDTILWKKERERERKKERERKRKGERKVERESEREWVERERERRERDREREREREREKSCFVAAHKDRCRCGRAFASRPRAEGHLGQHHRCLCLRSHVPSRFPFLFLFPALALVQNVLCRQAWWTISRPWRRSRGPAILGSTWTTVWGASISAFCNARVRRCTYSPFSFLLSLSLSLSFSFFLSLSHTSFFLHFLFFFLSFCWAIFRCMNVWGRAVHSQVWFWGETIFLKAVV